MTSAARQTWIEEALAHHNAGRLAQAEQIYRQILSTNPIDPDALHLLGVVAHQVGKHQNAIELISAAIRINPRNADYHINLGEALSSVGQIDCAIASYRAAIEINPEELHAYNNLAVVLMHQHKLDEASAALEKILARRPDDYQALSNLAIIQSRRQNFDESIRLFERALHGRPDWIEGLCNLGTALLAAHRIEEATNAFRRAVMLDASHAVAQNNLGLALQQSGFLKEAVEHYRRAIELDPRYITANDNLLLALHYATGASNAELFKAHWDWARRFVPAGYTSAPHENVREENRRLKIGFVSADFKRHSVAFFLEPLLTHLDREQFEITCYSDTPTSDEVTLRLQKIADHWQGIQGISNGQVANEIRARQIDVLFDLSGHTAHNRLMLFARKPAPIQISYLGYPDTTGLTSIDYRLTDIYADPVASGASEIRITENPFYTEKLIHLPRTCWCYQPPGDVPDVLRDDGNAITFGSFNTLAKLSPQTLTLWSRILCAVPGARLVLKAHGMEDSSARKRILDHFCAHDVSPDRITLLAHARSPGEHFQAYRQVDIALDTFPYHGTTTTCDALYMGVPVIALAGDHHVSRVGLSLLTAMGLQHFIAKSPDEYVAIATALAKDRERLGELRKTLRDRMKRSPLMDASDLARHVGAVLRSTWRMYCSG